MFDFDVRSGRDAAESEILVRLSRVHPLRGELLEPLSRVPHRPPLVLAPSTTLDEAHRLFGGRRLRAALVSSHGMLLGVVTEAQVLRRLIADATVPRSGETTPVWRVMGAKTDTLVESDSVAYAIRKLGSTDGGTMPIVRPSGTPSGLIDCHDILMWLCDRLGGGAGSEHPLACVNNS